MRYWTLCYRYDEYHFCTEFNYNFSMFERMYSDCSETEKKYIDKIFKAFNLDTSKEMIFDIVEDTPQQIDFSE